MKYIRNTLDISDIVRKKKSPAKGIVKTNE
jgi:hypothetical protein